MNHKNLAKVIVIGDSAVGKTSLLHSFVDQKFMQSYKATIGADFMIQEVIIDGKAVNLEIWDTAGQQKFKSMGQAFYRGGDCCILVYDISDKKSFDNIQSWLAEYLNKGQPQEPDKFPFFLVSNKSDLQEERQVDSQSIREFMQAHPNVKHFQTSAKLKTGVKEVFDEVARSAIANKKNEIFIPVLVNTTKLVDLSKNRANKKICC